MATMVVNVSCGARNRDEPLVGSWHYFSPGMWTLNELVQNGDLFNMSIPQRVNLVLESNQYSLRALVLHIVCRSMHFLHGLSNRMRALHDKMDLIWRRKRGEGWSSIEEALFEIWRIRSLMASKYIQRFPQSTFKSIFEPLILCDEATSSENGKEANGCCNGCAVQ